MEIIKDLYKLISVSLMVNISLEMDVKETPMVIIG